MKSLHENALDRADNGIAFYKKNQAELEAVKVLKDGFANLEELYVLITGKRPAGEMKTNKFTEQKNELLREASKVAIACTGPLLAYAKKEGLTEVLSLVSAARTDYYQKRKMKMVSNYESLRQQYATALPNMKDYNASQVALDLLDQTVISVKAALSKPASVRSDRKLTNQEIDDAVQKMNALFRDVLQPNMDGFILSKPELYNAWLQASKMVNLPASHSSNATTDANGFAGNGTFTSAQTEILPGAGTENVSGMALADNGVLAIA